MKVTGRSLSEIEIDRKTQHYVCVMTLCEAFDFNPTYVIENNEVVDYIEYYGSHRWDERKVIRLASSTDHIVFAAIKRLRVWLYEEGNVRSIKRV